MNFIFSCSKPKKSLKGLVMTEAASHTFGRWNQKIPNFLQNILIKTHVSMVKFAHEGHFKNKKNTFKSWNHDTSDTSLLLSQVFSSVRPHSWPGAPLSARGHVVATYHTWPFLWRIRGVWIVESEKLHKFSRKQLLRLRSFDFRFNRCLW